MYTAGAAEVCVVHMHCLCGDYGAFHELRSEEISGSIAPQVSSLVRSRVSE